jgi:DNA-binding Lrp family transcriptional regulator
VDNTDLALCTALLGNSRTPYQELADKLGLSVNAVHRRIKGLVEDGVIKAFTARVGIAGLRAVNVWVFGRSDAVPLEEVHLRLQKNDMVYWVAYSGGGFVYIGAYLPDLSRLDELVTFVGSEAKMREPSVGIQSSLPFPPAEEKLHPLDYMIIKALHRDARKPLSDVALEVRASARTVQRRLDRMLRLGLVELSLDWYPDASDDIVSLCHVKMAHGSDKMKVSGALMVHHSPHVIFSVQFSNFPDQFVSFLWTNSMRGLKELKESILREEGIESTSVNVLSTGYIFDTWRDKLLVETR